MLDHDTGPRLDRPDEPARSALEPRTERLLGTHGDEKYLTSRQLGAAVDGSALRVEHRWIEPGAQNCVVPTCTEVVYILSGQTRVRRTAEGRTQEGVARAGTSWLVPAGTHETELQLAGAVECLVIFLPDTLLERSALADYDLDPERLKLAYVGGMADVTMAQLASTLRGLVGREPGLTGRMVADATRTALAAHLIGHYTVDRWRPAERTQSLEAKRLKRVLDFIEARLGEDLSLDDLASEACLSPFHFSRLFNDATGLSPHRFLVQRRIQAAQAMLAADQASLAEIALDTGFGSQANFTRVFRKATGLTPGQYRSGRGVPGPPSSLGTLSTFVERD